LDPTGTPGVWPWFQPRARRALSLTSPESKIALFSARLPGAARSPGHSDSNPKIDPAPNSNTEKEPDDWVSGDDPMTGAQASYLKTLSEQCGEPETFSQT
jgi:hypothetical protein